MIAFPEFLHITRERTQARGETKDYSWQRRLAERCAQGEPPAAIAIPTGAGKTTTIDALVWALAQQADRPAAERTIGVRIVWAIDRRILVDEVYEHARRLADLLAGAADTPGDPLGDVAARLERISSGPPLVATRWRGGLDDLPERCGPLQPQIISSTVAQIGSRLLFRGYGVGRRSLAIEAGLAACDTTICLDEAHLAEPFRETIEAIRAQRETGEGALALAGLRAITLTATPPRELEDVLGLDDEDRAALGRRFTGEKRAKLVVPEAGIGEAGQVRLLATTAADYVRSGKSTVACIVNTVRRARAVFDALRKELGGDAAVALLIGPQRPADRERVIERHRGALFDGRPGEKPLVCVATQTFEVGLDADVAAMVTESASAMALVQRLGRLNRRGETSGCATIVRDEGRWLYEEDEPVAWEWLEQLAKDDGSIDVSVAALERSAPPRPRRVPRAATLTQELVELLAQTSPLPAAWREPDPDVFLRGVGTKPSADVAVCWRSDLRADLTDGEVDGYRAMLLELVPPQRQELMTLSITGARALLAARYPESGNSTAAARRALDEVDVEDTMLDAPVPRPSRKEDQLPFVVLRGGVVHRGALNRTGEDLDGVEVNGDGSILPNALKPGDVVVLPTSAGGADEHGLAPREEAAIDVACDLRPSGTRVPVRLTPEALAPSGEKQLARKRWERIERACTQTEMKIAATRGEQERQRHVDRLVERLLQPGLVGDHGALELLAKGAPERAGGRVLLRSISLTKADGTPQFDDAEMQLDDGDSPNDADSEGDTEVEVEIGADAEGKTGEGAQAEQQTASECSRQGLRDITRAWVLLPVPDRPDRSESFLNQAGPPTIDQHARAVGGEVRECAARLRLAPKLSAALTQAACAHDHGKADARTQAFYRGGVRALAATPIAKSEFGTRDPRTSRIAAQLAGLPTHLHHEIASVAILEHALGAGLFASDGLDLDLMLHLAGVHHGRGRPIPDVPAGGKTPRPFEIDAAGIKGAARGDGRDGWAEGAWLERFWRVVERYGPWGVAYLEALLVLSDRVVSSRGE